MIEGSSHATRKVSTGNGVRVEEKLPWAASTGENALAERALALAERGLVLPARLEEGGDPAGPAQRASGADDPGCNLRCGHRSPAGLKDKRRPPVEIGICRVASGY